MPHATPLAELAAQIEGTLVWDDLHRTIYATDASVYRELPLAVAFPMHDADLKAIIRFAKQYRVPLLPRTAGTSLAGQCVGEGIVVDLSRHFNKIIEWQPQTKTVRVQPGVVRDELNAFLKPHGYFFSPVTSTANRAMIGGMVGNNSCGTTSIVYGTTRDHVIRIKALLSDASEVVFEPLTGEELQEKCQLSALEGKIYRQIVHELNQPEVQKHIREGFPKPGIHRRNTGYAVDALLGSQPFVADGAAFNFCKLLCGSEGTLAFSTEITLHVDPLPPPCDVVVAAHFHTVHDSMVATQVAMGMAPTACELMDKVILDCTRESKMYSKLRYFVEGDPATVLMVEFRGHTEEEAMRQAEEFVSRLQQRQLGYAYPVIRADKTAQVWALRSAGLGLLGNIPGDPKAVACIEDTAVELAVLPDYIDEVGEMMLGFGQEPVYYAHAGAGEIHLRPILDLKKSEDVQRFYEISLASAQLVKKYGGSLSGEHGDGRVRAPFIPLVMGQENYELFKRIKYTWDPDNLFNPGKIVDTPPMNTALRYTPDEPVREFNTLLDFSGVGGILRAAEKCNGSGDCRKLPLSGGTMCPSYQATRNEKDTTRARANTLREFLTRSTRTNAFDHVELKNVMDLCISCKGCTSECPSNVDMAGMKAEFLHQYYQSNGVPLRAKAIAHIDVLNRWGSVWPSLYNFLLTNPLAAGVGKRLLGIAPQRSLPRIHPQSLMQWFQRDFTPSGGPYKQAVYLFCDEFTNYNDTPIGRQAVMLLDQLGYEVRMPGNAESGRAAISKGLLPRAKLLAITNVRQFSDIINDDVPLLGIEPSAILGFRDEYPRLVDEPLVESSRELAKNALLIDEFLSREIQAGRISADAFCAEERLVLLHGHCHQKALSEVSHSVWCLSLPRNYTVQVVPSGCCGMAGSFGYEAEHYEVSQQIGELVLLPAVRKAAEHTIIAAPGTSCRHQIADATGRVAKHPVTVLYEALLKRDN